MKIMPLVLGLLTLSALVGCAENMYKGGSYTRAAADAALGPAATATPPVVSGAAPPADKPVPTLTVIEARKVVYTGEFTLLVGDIPTAQDRAKAMVEQLGGYMQKMDVGMIILRVPGPKFDEAQSGLGKIGSIAQRRIAADDVTEKCFDLETRLRNQKALKEKILSLLGQARNSREALELEHEAAKTTDEIEQLEGMLNRLSSQVAFATLSVTFSSPVKYTPPELNVQLPFPWLRTLGLGTLMQFDGKDLY